jgi:hypothetical protein
MSNRSSIDVEQIFHGAELALRQISELRAACPHLYKIRERLIVGQVHGMSERLRGRRQITLTCPVVGKVYTAAEFKQSRSSGRAFKE